MSETLGSLMDKLSVVNIKIWHLQDQLTVWAQMPSGEFDTVQHKDIKGTIEKIVRLNVDRASLVRQIDETHAHDVEAGKALVDSGVKVGPTEENTA